MATKNKIRKRNPIELHLSNVIEEMVTVEINMSKDLMSVFETVSKNTICSKDQNKLDKLFVEAITKGLQEELLKFCKKKFKGNTNSVSNMVN